MKKLGTVILALLFCAAVAWAVLYENSRITIAGTAYSRDVTELDLSGIPLEDTDKLAELKNLKILDLRDTGLTVEGYERLRQSLPECTILWSVPFQSGYLSQQITELTVTELGEEDLERLAYFHGLTTVNALECRDYDMLERLKSMYPDLQIRYTVQIGDVRYRENTREITLEYSDIGELEQALPWLGGVRVVTFTGSVPENERVWELMCRYPDVVFIWDFELFGVRVNSLDTSLDLSGIPMESVAGVEEALKYLKFLEWVDMCDCGISSEEMDALWKRHPEIRFVWTVKIGACTLRTDATVFMPYKFGYNGKWKLYDGDTEEMKYLVDLICLDMGHMGITDYSFLEYMPNLKYLILADTPGKDFSPLANLRELIYLEIFMTSFTQGEVLTGLTKLEDLNLGNCWIDNIEPLKEMTWLKRLWMIGAVNVNHEERRQLRESLPDTVVNFSGKGSTGGGWRDSENYYAMRDLLDMGYMKK